MLVSHDDRNLINVNLRMSVFSMLTELHIDEHLELLVFIKMQIVVELKKHVLSMLPKLDVDGQY